MKVRCIHLDMKSMIPRFEFFMGMLKDIADMEYTHVLIEFEDKFPYECFPDAVSSTAYTKDEYRRIAARCRELGLGVIPLLQCVGHLEYFLKEPAYRKWSENDNIFQWCFSNKETLDAWKAMAEEILDVFTDSTYFHVGADEVKFNNPCPICADKDQFKLYVQRVNDCVDFVQSKGRQPLLWDDIFRNHELNESGDLLQKAIPCVWQYHTINKDIIRKYADAGIRYWSTSCIQTCERYQGMGKQWANQKNVDDWADIQDEFPAEGHIGTIWGRSHSLNPYNVTIPQGIYMAAYLAETLINGKIRDRHAFNARFADQFFGLPQLDMDTLANGFASEPGLTKIELEKYLGKAPRHNEYLEIWHMFNEIDEIYANIYMYFGANRALLDSFRKGRVINSIINTWTKGVAKLREMIDTFCKDFEEQMGKVYYNEEIQVYLTQRFMGILEQNDACEKILKETAAKPHL